GKQRFSLFYDASTKQLFGPANRNGNYIIDLDDPTVFSKPFKGFTTGEVHLRISADVYTSNDFQFMITKLGKNDLSVEVKDTEGPRIYIDFEGFSESNLPNGILGESYKVFDSYAID